MKKLNKKGFSLVELIIVIAIMVALVAVMAPTFVKYVAKSRDSVLQHSAENVCEMVKGEYASEHLDVLTEDGKAEIYIFADDNGLTHVYYDETKLNYSDGDNTIASICGVDESKKCYSKKVFKIQIDEGSNGHNLGQIFKFEEVDEELRSSLLTKV